MAKTAQLVIVESPTKAKTIKQILGNKYVVEASMGHLRDLPKAKLGVDTEHNFIPEYVIPTASRKIVTKLKNLYAEYPQIILATDEDREGEAIAWHITQALGIDPVATPRIVFHEITTEAVQAAIASPRHLDQNLVDAQQARRVLDRLVGYKLSPLLWKKLFRGLSAGRVQSVAVRLIVEREREIEKFTPQEYWKVKVDYEAKQDHLLADLVSIGGKPVAIDNSAEAAKVKHELELNPARISQINFVHKERFPNEPLTTSTLQQQAGTRFGFSVKKTMMLAQQLYEGVSLGKGQHTGLITYMRTDSVYISPRVIQEMRDFIGQTYGQEYVPATIPRYKSKNKSAQEAHEAIRPTMPATHTPKEVAAYLNPDQKKLYQLIWERTVASQMAPAQLGQTNIAITSGDKILTIQGVTIEFKGFLAALSKNPITESVVPKLEEGLTVVPREVMTEQKFTEPSERYTEPALVKALEKLGIGRPSTYAPTLTTITTRGYVKREKKYLYPQETGILVNDFLVKHFPDIVDTKFTATMEDKLDDVADGKVAWQKIVEDFYHPFAELLKNKEANLEKQNTGEATNEICSECQGPMVIKRGKFGKFLACANFPECKHTQPLEDNAATPKAPAEPTDVVCEKCGSPMVKRKSRYGEFLGCSNYPKCKHIQNLGQPSGDMGLSCPTCGTGKIVERRTKRGRVFYGCSNYPKCDFASWNQPTDKVCPTCQGPMALVKAKGGAPVCQKCGFVDKDIT
ncbi:TPA: type I DNA topoisomerase [Patescibacteria group bacterium]|nr:type I DNA topoisomerase [Patescibacteria group bacterium]